MRSLILLSLFVALAACATTKLPPPAVELRTVTVKVPVATPCLTAEQIPPAPPRIASQLTGDARHDLDLITAAALRLRSWGDQMHAALEACAVK